MSNNYRFISYIILLLAFLLFSIFVFFLGRNSVDIPKPETIIQWDTVYKEKPVPYKVETKTKEYIYVPDTVNRKNTQQDVKQDSIPARQDSIPVVINIESKVYEDERFKAVISGPRIGEFSPNLDEINIYAKTETKIIEKPTPFITPYISSCVGKEIIGLGGGISIKQKVDIGCKYIRVNSNDFFVIEANFRFNK